MHESIANWQWLVPLPQREYAAVLARPEDAADRPLTRGFGRTHVVNPAEWPREAGQFMSAWSAQFPDASLDCVAIPDADRMTGTWAGSVAALRTMHRSLKPAVGVCVAIESTEGASRLARASRTWRSPIAHRLRRAGFSRILVYYIVVNSDHAMHLLPADRGMLLAWDRVMEQPGLRATIRRLLIRSGLEALFFPLRLIVAS